MEKSLEGHVEEVNSSDLQCKEVMKEEQHETVLQVIRNDPLVVFWCFFFAFSTVGW